MAKSFVPGHGYAPDGAARLIFFDAPLVPSDDVAIVGGRDRNLWRGIVHLIHVCGSLASIYE